MSFIKKQTRGSTCSCQDQASTTTFRLTVEPEPTDVREAAQHDGVGQLVNAERVQDMFLPHLVQHPAHEYGNGYHVHPNQPDTLAHIDQLHDMLDNYGLCARVSLARGGDHSTVAAPLERAHVAQLIENGVADIQVPLSDDTFRLHSTQTGRITAVEFVASS